jgi:hypothetical protein
LHVLYYFWKHNHTFEIASILFSYFAQKMFSIRMCLRKKNIFFDTALVFKWENTFLMAESCQNVNKHILFIFKFFQTVFLLLIWDYKTSRDNRKNNWGLGDYQDVLNMDIPRHNWLVLGIESPNKKFLETLNPKRVSCVREYIDW